MGNAQDDGFENSGGTGRPVEYCDHIPQEGDDDAADSMHQTMV